MFGGGVPGVDGEGVSGWLDPGGHGGAHNSGADPSNSGQAWLDHQHGIAAVTTIHDHEYDDDDD